MKRRDFFRIMGIASGAALTACSVDDADKKILPYLVPPEDDVIPGIPRYVRSTCMECPAQCGINIKIRDDKPVKLEGNPDHPVNKGTLCMRGQASLARLYHPERFKEPMAKQADGSFKAITWEEAVKRIKTALRESEGKRNVYWSSRTTGTLSRLIDEFGKETRVERLKEFEVFHHGPTRAANQQLMGNRAVPYYRIDQCDALLTLGADLFETFVSPVEWQRLVRRARENNHAVWSHVEPYTTITGAAADERLVNIPGGESYLLAYLLKNIPHKNPVPETLTSQIPEVSAAQAAEKTGIKEEDILKIKHMLETAEKPLIITGGPALAMHHGHTAAQYTALLQWALGMVDRTVDFSQALTDENTGTGIDIGPLAKDFQNGNIGTAFFSRLRGFHMFPKMREIMTKARFKVALAQVPDDVTQICDIILPLSDPLESWGDAQPRQGVQSVIQPVIEPQFNTQMEGDILLGLMGVKMRYRDYLSLHWKEMDESWIETGVKITQPETVPVALLPEAKLETPEPPLNKDVVFAVPSLRSYDGRSRDIKLLSEIPDPVMAVSYDDWFAVSPEWAEKENIKQGALVQLENKIGKIELPVCRLPGLQDKVPVISIDALKDFPPFVDGPGGQFVLCFEDLKLNKTRKRIQPAMLAGARTTGTRSILPHLEHDDHDHGHHPEIKPQHRSLYEKHEHKDYRWGLVIDLDACSGCSSCVAACYVENNVPVVGREEHIKGREMTWLRMEAYYNNPNRPEFIPMMCQQCDSAPCETVCPVYATYHNPEGLNAQVYNRCVGTRYCANNCPYKVRRFNWFDHDGMLPLYHVSNPDLSVRPKGVMEKCSFCIQRIRFAKDRAKDENRKVRDGEIIPACAQTCPAGAITFGNLEDPGSKVAKLAKSKGAYRIQELLGTEPAVYYIKKTKKDDRK